MFRVEVNLETGEARIKSDSKDMNNIVPSCFMVVQTLFNMLIEHDEVSAEVFLRGVLAGVPFISEAVSCSDSDEDVKKLLEGILETVEDSDKQSDRDTYEFVKYLLEDYKDDSNADPAPIFKGIMFTKGKGDSKNETN